MLDRDNTALALIDVQGNLAHAMSDKEILFYNLQRLIKGAKVLNLPIFWAEQIPEKLGPTIPEIAELLDGYNAVSKNTFSCYGNNSFAEAVKASGKTLISLSLLVELV